MDLELLRERARIIGETRDFFKRRGYLEVDTPLLAPDLIPESCLEVFETRRLPPPGSRREPEPLWLVPSPEIWMKKLLARHRVKLFQICKCFRNGESSGRFHSPEFTMLEYYTPGAGYMDSLALTEELLGNLAPEGSPELRPPFERINWKRPFAAGRGSAWKGRSGGGAFWRRPGVWAWT
jgi:lysyl-tRNA synthetase class 2